MLFEESVVMKVIRQVCLEMIDPMIFESLLCHLGAMWPFAS